MSAPSLASLSSLSPGQVKVVRAALVRRDYPVPDDDSSLVDFLAAEGRFRTGFSVVDAASGKEEGRLPPDPSSYRDLTLCCLGEIHALAAPRRRALATLLAVFEEHPGIFSDPVRLKLTVAEMNHVYERELSTVYAEIDRALERFNDNIGLGRPALTALETLVNELTGAGVFRAPRGAEGKSRELRDVRAALLKMVETGKAGKTHSARSILEAMSGLDALVRAGYAEAAAHWYNDVMVKHYVRDTLIPHAVLNNYIDPFLTSDVMGGIFNFVKDSKSNRGLIYCDPLLFHQPQQPGARYIRVTDLLAEAAGRAFDPAALPVLARRYADKAARVADVSTEEPSPAQEIRLRPYWRVAAPLPWLGEAIAPYLADDRAEEAFAEWSFRSIHSIDPSGGLPAQALSAVLGGVTADVIAQTFDPFEADTAALTERFVRLVRAKCDAVLAHLALPFESHGYAERGEVDPFEAKEALVNALLEGFVSPSSDWEEESRLAGLVSECARLAEAHEEDGLDDVGELVRAFERLSDGVDDLARRASAVVFDGPGLALWYVCAFHVVAESNDVSFKKFLGMRGGEDFSLPLNGEAFRRAVSGEAETLVRRAAAQVVSGGRGE